jgi:hypothetical protein
MNTGAINKDGGFSYIYGDDPVKEIKVDSSVYKCGFDGFRGRPLEYFAKKIGADIVNVWHYTEKKLWYIDFAKSKDAISDFDKKPYKSEDMVCRFIIPQTYVWMIRVDGEVVWTSPKHDEA